MPVRAEGDGAPTLADDVFIAPNAEVVGDVTMAERSSVWFSSVIRANGAPVSLGVGTDVQDNSIVESRPGQPCRLGDFTSLGHGAAVHASTVGRTVLIAMNATVLAGCIIGDECIIAANAVVPEGTTIPSGSLVIGSAGKVARELTPEERERVARTSRSYQGLSAQYREEIGRGW